MSKFQKSIESFNLNFCHPRGFHVQEVKIRTTSCKTTVCVFHLYEKSTLIPVETIIECAKYNPRDARQGLPFKRGVGRALAFNRAKKATWKFICGFGKEEGGKAPVTTAKIKMARLLQRSQYDRRRTVQGGTITCGECGNHLSILAKDNEQIRFIATVSGWTIDENKDFHCKSCRPDESRRAIEELVSITKEDEVKVVVVPLSVEEKMLVCK